MYSISSYRECHVCEALQIPLSIGPLHSSSSLKSEFQSLEGETEGKYHLLSIFCLLGADLGPLEAAAVHPHRQHPKQAILILTQWWQHWAPERLCGVSQRPGVICLSASKLPSISASPIDTCTRSEALDKCVRWIKEISSKPNMWCRKHLLSACPIY